MSPVSPQSPPSHSCGQAGLALSLNSQHRQGTGSFILSQDLTSRGVRRERPKSGQQFGKGQRGLDGL